MQNMDESVLIDRIYEAALIPELWSGVIEDIADVTDCYGGSIYTCGDGYAAIASSKSCEDALSDLISLGWAERNIRAHSLVSQKVNAFITDKECCTEEEIQTHPIYTEFLRPRGLGWTAATYIVGSAEDFAIFSIDQRYERGPVSAEVVHYLNNLRPHIARAAALSSRFRRQQAESFVAHLDTLGIPALLVSGSGAVLHVNSLFQSTREQILIGAYDKISLKDRRANILLQKALMGRSDGKVLSIPVLADASAAPLVLNVIPLRRDARDLFARVEYVVTVAPLGHAQGELPQLLSMLYDLSAAETRVVQNLCAGETPQGIADKYSLSVETIRTQIKSVLSKTGMSKQSELISRFLSVKL